MTQVTTAICAMSVYISMIIVAKIAVINHSRIMRTINRGIRAIRKVSLIIMRFAGI